MPVCELCEASLEAALDGISSQIIGAVVLPLDQEQCRLVNPHVGKLLEIAPVHRNGLGVLGQRSVHDTHVGSWEPYQGLRVEVLLNDLCRDFSPNSTVIRWIL